MADDLPPALKKLSQQLVMTPQLQLAIKILSVPSSALPVDEWRAQFAGLDNLPVGEPDPMDVEAAEEAAKFPDPEHPPWFPATESPLPALAEVPDVWVYGNPPQARANRHAYPRLTATTDEARWLVRSLRQRAKTYEQVVRVAVELRPELAVALEPESSKPIAIRELAERAGFHESTVERVASAVRFQNLHVIVGMTKQSKKLGFTR